MSGALDKSLREGLHVLLLHASPEDVLGAWLDGGRREGYRGVPGAFPHLLSKARPEQFSLDDAQRVSEILQRRMDQSGALGVFGLISDFASQTLVQRESRPLVRYEQVLRWRDTVHPLGTLPFLSAFLAREDAGVEAPLRSFCLNPVPQTDNRRLSAILEQGMAENHFHLKGASPAFLLSWICLMNDMTGRTEAFAALEGLELGESVQRRRQSLHTLVFRAAVIRALLFLKLEGCDTGEDEARALELLGAETPVECAALARPLQRMLDGLRAVFAAPIDGMRADYAAVTADASARERPFLLLSGEWRFQYRMFRAIFEGGGRVGPYLDLFYAYLMICVRFRAELIQCNRRIGFQNFSEYDRRKGGFIEGRRLFEEAQSAAAAYANLSDGRIRALEVRVVPGLTPRAIAARVHRVDGLLEKAGLGARARERMYYVLHIPKRPDRPHRRGAAEYVRCRDFELRGAVAAVADGLIRLREGNDGAARRIRGMDACANEADTRPEVFAPAYRRLKAHQPRRPPDTGLPVPMLNVTYHVGEDFSDVVDGLRAIWEAVEFLELGRSDRIGHGLALGIDPEGWYEAKGRRVYLTRQALLDNCAWMLELLGRCGEPDLRLAKELEEVCVLQYAAVYQSTLPFQEREMAFDRVNYFSSLLLRGDEPDCYRDYQDHGAYLDALELRLGRDPYCLRDDAAGSPCAAARRHNMQAIRLYHHYHFNPDTKERGEEVVEFEAPAGYARAAARLQRLLQRWVGARGVGIETNPSSNVLIGSFKRYDRHPLIQFNDLGLLDRPENPGLFVSINTDDQGIFDTCLENEYALMARGLEQLTDGEGRPALGSEPIYRWLDRVRRMGLEQSFLQG